MKTFYNVTLFCFALGLVILCCDSPWTLTPVGSPYSHVVLGYAPVWSGKFSNVPGARVDWSAFALLAGGVGFFFDCGWGFSVFLSGEARAGKGSGRIS